MARNDEMFSSVARSSQDQAGVFEYDRDVGYFYLYETGANNDKKIVAAIRILVGEPDFNEEDVAIRWNSSENIVGLFIRNQLWAAFNLQTGAKHGGNYCTDNQPMIPVEISDVFKS